MNTLSWTARDEVGPGASLVVMASRFRLRRFRDVPRFLLDSLLIRRQVCSAPGGSASGSRRTPCGGSS